tara:strand:+ start:6047 stop:6391 length:345 start_codon:yes stop_codon:yes gene_type:complete
MSSTQYSATPLTVFQAGSLQKDVFRSVERLRSLRDYAVSIADMGAVPILDQLLENAQTYSMFLEELMTPSLERSDTDKSVTPTLLAQIRQHCELVDKAYADQESATLTGDPGTR